MKFILKFQIYFMIILIGSWSQAKQRVIRKIQEVNFSEMSVKGTIRNPDGAYLVQKKGVKFMPLHDLQKNMDEKIRESADYL